MLRRNFLKPFGYLTLSSIWDEARRSFDGLYRTVRRDIQEAERDGLMVEDIIISQNLDPNRYIPIDIRLKYTIWLKANDYSEIEMTFSRSGLNKFFRRIVRRTIICKS